MSASIGCAVIAVGGDRDERADTQAIDIALQKLVLPQLEDLHRRLVFVAQLGHGR